MKRIVYSVEISFYIDDNDVLDRVQVENGMIIGCQLVGSSVPEVESCDIIPTNKEVSLCQSAIYEITEFCYDELGNHS